MAPKIEISKMLPILVENPQNGNGNGHCDYDRKEGSKFHQYLSASIAAVGSFIVGIVLAWSGPILPIIKDYNSTSAPIHTTDIDEISWLAALPAVGAIFGALPAGFIAGALGPKKTLVVFSIPSIACWAFILFGKTIRVFYAARFISGIVTGVVCAVIPAYVADISEDSIRGRMGSFFQLYLTAGILFTYLLGIFQDYVTINTICLAVATVYLPLVCFIPESPPYLLKKHKKAKAAKNLQKLRGKAYDIRYEIGEMRGKAEHSISEASPASHQKVFTKANVKALIISFVLMMFQQLSGVNAVISYTTQIFQDAGSSLSPILCSIVVGAVQFFVTIAAGVFIDKAGRRILLLVSGSTMAVCLSALAYYFRLKEADTTDLSQIAWLPLGCVALYMVAFALGAGPIPWMIASELFGQEIKGFGTGISVAINWTCAFLITKFFPAMTTILDTSGTFLIFALVCLIGTTFVFFVLPETKGKSLREIQRELSR